MAGKLRLHLNIIIMFQSKLWLSLLSRDPNAYTKQFVWSRAIKCLRCITDMLPIIHIL